MQGTRLDNNVVPTVAGQYSYMEYGIRQVHHPDERGDGEWWVCDPNSKLFRLIKPIHSWEVHDDGSITVTPSIVSPTGGYHGFLIKGVWS